MLEVSVQNDSLAFGAGFTVGFQRTLRIPDDGHTYPLPPGLGPFPIYKVADFEKRVPSDWLERGGVFIPMYQREALWISFVARYWKPNAVKVAVGKVNAVSGGPWEQELGSGENDYLVCPPQPWLDGINAGEGVIRQFVAMPLGMGYTIEAQVTGEERFGGIQIVVYEPKPGRFPDEPPAMADGLRTFQVLGAFAPEKPEGVEMGLAAGGQMAQKIYPDPHGRDTWDEENCGLAHVHIVNSAMFREITGEEPPPTPVTARTYTENGLPWFDLYDDHMGTISAPAVLSEVKTVKEMDQEKGLVSRPEDESVAIPEDSIRPAIYGDQGARADERQGRRTGSSVASAIAAAASSLWQRLSTPFRRR